jgi:hypothetical protein
MTFDELRAAHPDKGFALYAMEPGAGVTLEVYADGGVFPFTGDTAQAAIDAGFPPLAFKGVPIEFDPPVTPNTVWLDPSTGQVLACAGPLPPTSVFD